MKFANKLGLLAILSALGGACVTSSRFVPNNENIASPPPAKLILKTNMRSL